jgi:hypothetical protein
MPGFSALLGKRVEVSYRAGDIMMTATGKLAVDSGQIIRLEERFMQSGREKTLLLEIPYPSIVRVREIRAEAESSSAS